MVATRLMLEEPDRQERFTFCLLGCVQEMLRRYEPAFSALPRSDRFSIMVAIINKTAAIMSGEKSYDRFIN